MVYSYLKPPNYVIICLQQWITDTEFITGSGLQNLKHVTFVSDRGYKGNRKGVEGAIKKAMLETDSIMICILQWPNTGQTLLPQ